MKLFNKGIYKSTLRRFCWGSVFYFVVLFMITGMIILMNEEPSFDATAVDIHILLRYGTYVLPSVVIGIGVAAITAMLVYRFVHSKKQAIFTHSLPVTREANFISTALAGLTLMAAPIILNGIVLITMALTGYGYLFTVSECMIWIGINLLCVFVMFAYSTLAAMLTGNTFAVVVLNILLYSFVVLITLGFSSIAMGFLYGYSDTNTVLNFVAANNPVVWIIEVTDDVCNVPVSVDVSKMILHIIAALVLYALSLVIYKHRRMETAEDVAAFKILNPIYKYFITALATLAAFGFFMNIGRNLATIITVMVIVSLLAYFGSEMALKKTLKVWRSYRGYLGFGAVFAAMLAVFALTSFFGFEARVPDIEDIDQVAVYQYYYRGEEPFVDNMEIEEYTLKLHNELLAGEDASVKWCAGDDRATNIHIKYKLKNGNIIHRRYGIDHDKKREIMNVLYKHDDYKLANEEIFKEEIKDIKSIRLNHGTDISGKDFNELLECVRKDVLALDYNQMHMDYTERWSFSLAFEYLIEEETLDTVAAPAVQTYKPNAGILGSVYTDINANYKNTIAWLKTNGYWDKVATLPQSGAWYICEDKFAGSLKIKYTSSLDPYMKGSPQEIYDKGEASRFTPLYKLTSAEVLAKTTEFIYNYEIRETDGTKYYTIVSMADGGELADGFTIITNIDEFSAKVLIGETNAEVVMQQ